jgi:phage terminase large subunit
MAQTKIQIPSEFSRLVADDWREAAVYGGRYSLKSHTVARLLLAKAAEKQRRFGCFREFQNSIGDSSHQLLADLIEQYRLRDFTVTRDAIVNNKTGSDFLFKGLRNNTQSVKSIEGIDYAWVEEAQTITEESIEVLTPTIRKDGSKIIWTYNRLNELDPVHKRLVIEGRPNTIIINANYTVAEKYNWLAQNIKDELEFDRVNNPELFQHKWLGEPLSQTEMAILSRTSIIDAMQRKTEGDGAVEIGVDVARMGNDRTVLWKRKGLRTEDFEVYSKLRTTQVCDRIEMFADFDKTTLIKIDDSGVGGGVTDEMLKRGYNIVAINFGGEPADKDKYPNWISEAWFYMSTILPEAQLPYDGDLIMELSTRQWTQDNKGKRQVESKNDYKKRGFRSPDLADACIICYAPAIQSGFLQWAKERTSKPDSYLPA